MSEVEELARMTGRSSGAIYYLARKLGRLPTLAELEQVKMGRPRKRRSDDIALLAKQTGRSRQTIYNYYWELGRLPTKEEVLNRKLGRKPKYTIKGKDNGSI